LVIIQQVLEFWLSKLFADHVVIIREPEPEGLD